jgi:hypothetical protein
MAGERPSLTDLLSAAPGAPAADSTDDLGFIGMPKGYVPMRTPTPYRGGPISPAQAERRATPQIMPPRYKTGDEMEPRSYSAENIARLQQQLAQAGLIGPETRFRVGVWDSTSVNAYKNLLGYANQGGISREDALQTLLTAPMARGAEGVMGEKAPRFEQKLNAYEFTDPARVRQTAEAAFQEALGRKPKKDELDRFVRTWQSQEQRSQKAVFDVEERMLRQRIAAEDGIVPDRPDGAGGSGSGSEADVLWDRLQQLIADAPGKVTPGKRTRSYEEQVRLYEKYKSGKGALAAKPGTSKHGDGRANDLKYENQATKRWVLENAGRYGLAFPLLNRGEDWHIEVAGGTLPAGHSHGDGHDHGPAAPPAGGVRVENVSTTRADLGAQALEYARSVNPDETAAYGIGQQFNALLQILQRGVV